MKFTVLDLFLETALDTAVYTNRFLEATPDPTTSRSLFIEAVRSRAASIDTGIWRDD